MDDLLTDFIAETREMMEAIEGEIIAWEASPSDSSRLDAIFRFVHTVKGNCGFFDLPRLERLSHAAEDVLSEVRAGRREPDARLVSTILASIDCIGEMVNAIEAEVPFPRGRELPLISALERGEDVETEAEEAPKSSKPSETQPAAPRSIRLPVNLLDRVMSGVSDMVLARNDLANRLQGAGTQPTIDGPFERLTSILNDVRDAITRMRMQPVEQLFAPIPRIVRDLSQELGKQVLVEIEGSDVELDREVIEIIRDPLTHIVRNAVDHGIESPSQRIEAGKHEAGLLHLTARQTGNRISLVISDDGRGLDDEKIAYKALANGLITEEQRAKMDSHAIHQLIFEPGLSTASTVSNISGRGVGMDVVRDKLERVGGWIDVSSKAGEGTAIHLHIPLTMSIIAGLIVQVAGQRFALPQSYVEEVAYGADADLEPTEIGDACLVTMRGQRVPCLFLADILGLERSAKIEDHTFLLLRLAKGDQFVLAFDSVHNIGDIVIKPLAPSILKTDLYSGTALLDDGEPILLLDLPLIAINCGVADPKRTRAATMLEDSGETTQDEHQTAMHFVALDGSQQAVRLELVKRIETISTREIDLAGTSPHAIVDGEILPLAGCDDAPISGAKIRLLRLNDGSRELVYAVSEVLDTVPLTEAPLPSKDNAFVEGHLLIDGQAVALLNGAALFEAFGSDNEKLQPTVCNLPDSEWGRSILAPLLASNGYAITYGQGQGQADILIAIEEEDGEQASKQSGDAAPMIHLHVPQSEEDGDAPKHDASLRFERSALLAVLDNVSNRQRAAGGKS